jgi:nucleoside-diphosphate-sugar epimerase
VSYYRLTNVFGKWCRPNYNSVVATFCHNIARDLPITISDPARELDLVHVDDVVGRLWEEVEGRRSKVEGRGGKMERGGRLFTGKPGRYSGFHWGNWPIC